MLSSKFRTIIWPRNGTGFHIVPDMTSKNNNSRSWYTDEAGDEKVEENKK